MGLIIILEDENGNALETLPKELDYNDFQNINMQDFLLLKYIDFYGDTTFNFLQLHDLLIDFEKLKSILYRQQDTLQQIIDLIKISENKVHTFIKFYGD